jgi:hypothetical protein
VINEQLQLAQGLLSGPRMIEPRLAQRRPGDRERVDRVGLATHPPGAPLGGHQLRWHPHQLFACGKQLALERPRQLPAVLKRPQPLLAEARSPGDQPVVRAGNRSLVEHPSGLVDDDRR